MFKCSLVYWAQRCFCSTTLSAEYLVSILWFRFDIHLLICISPLFPLLFSFSQIMQKHFVARSETKSRLCSGLTADASKFNLPGFHGKTEQRLGQLVKRQFSSMFISGWSLQIPSPWLNSRLSLVLWQLYASMFLPVCQCLWLVSKLKGKVFKSLGVGEIIPLLPNHMFL